MSYSKEEYNSDPVFYCVNCLSLAVKELNNVAGLYVCCDCGNTHSEESDNIFKWDELYKAEYGKSYLIEEDAKV